MQWSSTKATAHPRAHSPNTTDPKPPWKLESLPDAESHRDDRVVRLRRQLAKLDEADSLRKPIRQVLEILLHCRKGERCGSPACPICKRNERGSLVRDMLTIWPDQPEVLVRLKALTLVHQSWIIPAGELDKLHPRTITDKLRKQFQRMGFTGIIIGGIDGSYDPDLEVWFIHVHLIVEGLTKEMVEKFRDLYPASERIPVPVMAGPVNEAARQFSYVCKSFWNWRHRYVDDEGHYNTVEKKRRVPEPHHTEYLLWLDRFAVSDLMLLVGLRRYGGQLRPWGNCQRASTSKRIRDLSSAIRRRIK